MPEADTNQTTSPQARPAYRYFVSYATAGGFGRTEVALRRPMRSLADVALVEKLLIDSNGFQLVVTHWQRFED